jgi:hypothetical protein
MSLQRDIRRSSKLYQGFREEPAQRAKAVRVNLPKAAAIMGQIEFVGYMTTHDGETHLYIHEFAPGSRPTLAAGPGRNEMVIVGGRYRVTDRGIVDLTASGREILHRKSRYEVRLLKGA